VLPSSAAGSLQDPRRHRGRAERATGPLRHTGNLIRSPEGAQAGRLQARLKVLTHPTVLVVAEIRYLPISRTRALMFFQLMTRYGHALMVLTSTKGFQDWDEIFGDGVAACALSIWLIRQCQLVIIRVQRPDMWQALPVRFSAGGDNVVRLVTPEPAATIGRPRLH